MMQLDEPEFGNYFVAAYPPFFYWRPEAVEPALAALERPTPGDARRLGIYVHIPFCVERCDYCFYLSHGDRPGEKGRYVEALLRELQLWAERPALAGRAPDFVYFGGGTPSVLGRAQLDALLDGLQQILPWTGVREVTFECAPRSVTAAKAALLRRAGVSRVSLGVQQLDDDVLRANGRVHLIEDVNRAAAILGDADFDVFNLDLIVGLVGETEASFDRGLERTLDLGTNSVTLYQLEIPLNTPLYRRLRATAAPAPVSWAVKRRRLARALAALEANGYTVRSAYTAVRDPRRHRFLYQDEQYRGADLLGLGVSAFSYLGGRHHQNSASLTEYLACLEAGRPAVARAYHLSDDERCVREFVLQLKLGRVESAPFRERFGVEIAERFAAPLGRFTDAGWLHVGDDGVSLTRQGLLRADRLLRDFYLPQHRGPRYS